MNYVVRPSPLRGGGEKRKKSFLSGKSIQDLNWGTSSGHSGLK